MNKYYDKEWEAISLSEWVVKFEDREYVQVDYTEFWWWTFVSTVWLWLDHSFWETDPVIFETMAFSSNEAIDQMQWRYHTLDEAKKWHREMCKAISSLLSSESNAK